MTVLYRQYRPLKLSEVLGQEHVVTTLLSQLAKDKLGHAYLFTGPRGVGKTSVARILARAANCLNPKHNEPDNDCLNCREMMSGLNLDFTEIDAASHTGVDNIREIIEHLSLPPSRGKYRVYVIDEVHMLSRGAFNAILKTLEEPPAHVIFILATTEVHKVPATVISRTQRFDFRKLTGDQILSHLKNVCQKQELILDEDILMSISQSVDGSVRDALVLLEKASHLTAESKLDSVTVQKLLGITPIRMRQELLQLINTGDLPKISGFFKNLTELGFSVEQFNKDFLEYLRKVLSDDMSGKVSKVVENFLTAHGQLRVSPVPELPLLVASIKSVGAAAEQAEAPDKSGGVIFNQEPAKMSKLAGAPVHIEVEQIQARWDDILSRVRNYNQSLLTALKLAEPVGAMNGSLTISFPYKFHAETVSAAKNRLVIERALEEIFGHKVSVKCVARGGELRQQSAVPEEKSGLGDGSDLLKSALDVLGGEVVE